MIRAGFGLLFLIWVQSQAPTPTLQFDAASIKPAAQLPEKALITMGGDCRGAGIPSVPFFEVGVGRCRFVGVSLARLFNYAYRSGLADDQIEGGPGWAKSDRFDIEATASDPSSATRAQLIQMLQQLLSDRFQLRFHRATKEVNGFLLVVSKNGLKMKQAQSDAKGGTRSSAGALTGIGNVGIIGFAISRALGVPVKDNTGLSGLYEIALKWTPDALAGTVADSGIPTDPVGGPSIFTAVQEQLGLRLEPMKSTVEYLVIDSAEKPSNN
jgi:uncharacterized protein (TIGR03435 family)